MGNDPIVSVLMTAYNREKYIAEAIESVLASTYKNFELIIIDDNSKDNTVNIIEDFHKQDDRIKVYNNPQNIGDYPNRNMAASYANGKYLKYVDSDDRIEKEGLEKMVNAMELFPEAGFGICSLQQQENRSFPFMLLPHESYQYQFFGPGLFHLGSLDVIFFAKCFY